MPIKMSLFRRYNPFIKVDSELLELFIHICMHFSYASGCGDGSGTWRSSLVMLLVEERNHLALRGLLQGDNPEDDVRPSHMALQDISRLYCKISQDGFYEPVIVVGALLTSCISLGVSGSKGWWDMFRQFRSGSVECVISGLKSNEGDGDRDWI